MQFNKLKNNKQYNILVLLKTMKNKPKLISLIKKVKIL